MSKLQLSLCCGSYDRTRAIFDGSVEAEGIDLICTPYKSPDELFRRTLTNMEYDICELSLSNYLYARSLRMPLLAIPVFPSRKFRHFNMYVNVNSVKEPGDLKGKKVGCPPSYYTTAAVWQRGILQHEYDVKPKEMKWFTEKEERLDFKVSKDVSIEVVEGGMRLLKDMLEKGDIDAMIGPKAFPTSNHVAHLFEDSKRVESDYFKRTRIYPIMHTIVIRERILKEHPWVAVNLLDMFNRAKAAWRNINANYLGGLAWVSHYVGEEEKILGKDPYPNGLKENRRVLEALIQYLSEQSVIQRDIKIDELFADNTIDT